MSDAPPTIDTTVPKVAAIHGNESATARRDAFKRMNIPSYNPGGVGKLHRVGGYGLTGPGPQGRWSYRRVVQVARQPRGGWQRSPSIPSDRSLFSPQKLSRHTSKRRSGNSGR